MRDRMGMYLEERKGGGEDLGGIEGGEIVTMRYNMRG